MVNVIVSSDPRYKVNKASIQSAVLNILGANNVSGKVEVEVTIVGDRKMHELNKSYRGLDETTDILTFPLHDPNPQPQHIQHLPQIGFVTAPDNWLHLGSIIISYPQAIEDAALDGKAIEEEISFLVEHGTNHLLGHHH